MTMSPIGFLTLLFSLEDLFSQTIGIIIGIGIGVVTILLAEVLMSYFKKPKLIFKAVNQGDKLGISVSVKKKMIKDARVRCNGISYPWVTFGKDGTKIENDMKDLYIGDTPSLFFPYQVSKEYVENVNTPEYYRALPNEQPPDEPCRGVVIIVKEITTQKKVYNMAYGVSEHMAHMTVLAQFTVEPVINASIRIIGEGVEEEKDYSLYVGLNNLNVPVREGKPVMDYVSYGFELKPKKKGILNK